MNSSPTQIDCSTVSVHVEKSSQPCVSTSLEGNSQSSVDNAQIDMDKIGTDTDNNAIDELNNLIKSIISSPKYISATSMSQEDKKIENEVYDSQFTMSSYSEELFCCVNCEHYELIQQKTNIVLDQKDEELRVVKKILKELNEEKERKEAIMTRLGNDISSIEAKGRMRDKQLVMLALKVKEKEKELIDVKKVKTDGMDNIVAKLKLNMQKKKEELIVKGNEIVSLKTEVQEMKVQSKNLEEQFHKEKERNVLLKDQGQLNNGIIRKLEEDVKNKAETLERVVLELQRRKEEVERKDTDIDKLKEDMCKIEEKVRSEGEKTEEFDMKTKVLQLEENNATIEEERRELKDKLGIAKENVNDLYGQLRMKNEKLAMMEKEVEIMLKGKEEEATRNKTLRMDNEQVRDENYRLKSKLRVPADDDNVSKMEYNEFKNFVIEQLSTLSPHCSKNTVGKKTSEITTKDVVETAKVDGSKKKKKKKQVKQKLSEQGKSNIKPFLNDDTRLMTTLRCANNMIEAEEQSTDDSSDEDDSNREKNKLPLVPGNALYSEKVSVITVTNKEPAQPQHVLPTNKKLLVLSTSITKGINYQRFNECFGSGTARFQKWPGGHARHMKNYVSTHLEEEKPDAVIIQAGGNDLSSNHDESVTAIGTIAKDVVEMAKHARSFGAQEIFVAGVPIRTQKHFQEHVGELNNTLKSLCTSNKFIFIDNSRITIDHLYDGVHLTNSGTKILADSYLEALCDIYRADWKDGVKPFN